MSQSWRLPQPQAWQEQYRQYVFDEFPQLSP
jgi:hypothetical protein